MVCVTTTHLRDQHRRRINLPDMLREAQVKDNRRRVKLALKQEIEYCMRIRVERAAALGRPAAARRMDPADIASTGARLIWN